MKQFVFRLTIALAALTLGISTVMFLIFLNPLPSIDLPKYPPECASESEAEIKHNFEIDWKWEFLSRFQESPLEKQVVKVDEAYRLLWIPTFDEPTVIRVWRSGENYFIVTKRLSRNLNDLTIGDLTVEKTRSLTAEEWNNFAEMVNHACFWKVPSDIEEIIVNDGASWIFEGLSDGEYHLVSRTHPSEYMKQIYRYLFKLTKTEIEFEDYL